MKAENPLVTALARARLETAPMLARWCALNGVAVFPVPPAIVARFVADCAPLGIDRLWPAVQDIQAAHVSLGLADPTLGPEVAAALDDVAGIAPPRSWPGDYKQRFRSLPYDLQRFVADHELQREKALRRAQNDAAELRRKLAAISASAAPSIQPEQETTSDDRTRDDDEKPNREAGD